MSREDAKVVVNSFQGGLVTEASALNAPEGTMQEAMNVRLLRDGSIMKRPGIVTGDTTTQTSTGILSTPHTDAGFQIFEWPQQDAKVIRIGSYLTYHKVNKVTGTSTIIAADMGSVILPPTVPASVAFSKDRIFISSKLAQVSVLVWGTPAIDAVGNFTAFPTVWEQFHPRVRDFTGVDNLLKDGTLQPTDERVEGKRITSPAFTNHIAKDELTRHMFYNLQNAGYPAGASVSGATPSGTQIVTNPTAGASFAGDPVLSCMGWSTVSNSRMTGTLSMEPYIPALSDPYDLGVVDIPLGNNSPNGGAFSRWLQKSKEFKRKLAGAFVHRLYDMDTDIKATEKEFTNMRDSGTGGIEPMVWGQQAAWDSATFFPVRRKASCVGTAFGRVWLGGIDVEGLENNIGYSKVILDSARDAEVFHQVNKPTDPEVNQLMDSDGGLLTIEGSGEIYDFYQFRKSLIVFAENGVWAITGSDGAGFKATDFSVSRISSVGCLGIGYYAEGAEGLFYLNRSSVNVISENQFGKLDTTDISTAAIQSKVSSLLKNKYNTSMCTLSYDPLNSKMYVNFKDYYREDSNGVQTSYADLRYSLIFDTVSKAWTERKRGEDPAKVGPYYDADGDIVRGLGTWYQGSYHSAPFTADQSSGDNMLYLASYVTGSDTTVAFCTESGESHSDRLPAEVYESTARINPVVLTDPLTDKQISYLEVYSENPKVLDASACTVNTNYSWSAEPTGTPFEAIRYDHYPVQLHHADNDVIITKEKVHGKGKAVDISFTNNEADKTFKILGYAFTYNYNQRP